MSRHVVIVDSVVSIEGDDGPMVTSRQRFLWNDDEETFEEFCERELKRVCQQRHRKTRYQAITSGTG